MWQNPLGIISEHIIYRTLQGTLFPLTLVQSCQSYHVIFKWPNAQISQTFSSVHLKDYRGDPNYLLLDIFQWLKWSEFLKPTLKVLITLTHTHSVCIIYIKICNSEMQKFLFTIFLCMVMNIYKSELRGNNCIKVVRNNNKK